MASPACPVGVRRLRRGAVWMPCLLCASCWVQGGTVAVGPAPARSFFAFACCRNADAGAQHALGSFNLPGNVECSSASRYSFAAAISLPLPAPCVFRCLVCPPLPRCSTHTFLNHAANGSGALQVGRRGQPAHHARHRNGRQQLWLLPTR